MDSSSRYMAIRTDILERGGGDPCPRIDDSLAAVRWIHRTTDHILDDAVMVNLLAAAAATAAQAVLTDAVIKLATEFGDRCRNQAGTWLAPTSARARWGTADQWRSTTGEEASIANLDSDWWVWELDEQTKGWALQMAGSSGDDHRKELDAIAAWRTTNAGAAASIVIDVGDMARAVAAPSAHTAATAPVMQEKRSDATTTGDGTARSVTVTGGGVDATVVGAGNTEAGGAGVAGTEEADIGGAEDAVGASRSDAGGSGVGDTSGVGTSSGRSTGVDDAGGDGVDNVGGVGAPATPTAATTKGKRKLSPASALLGNMPARRPTTELQAARTASVLASLLERGRETAWDTGDEDEAET